MAHNDDFLDENAFEDRPLLRNLYAARPHLLQREEEEEELYKGDSAERDHATTELLKNVRESLGMEEGGTKHFDTQGKRSDDKRNVELPPWEGVAALDTKVGPKKNESPPKKGDKAQKDKEKDRSKMVFTAPHRCRICQKSSYTLDNRMLQPCSCRGSIGYGHERCILEWMKRSQTLTCAVCHTTIAASKLYDKDAERPESASFILKLYRASRLTSDIGFRISGRLFFAGTLWLVLYPLLISLISIALFTNITPQWFRGALVFIFNFLGIFQPEWRDPQLYHYSASTALPLTSGGEFLITWVFSIILSAGTLLLLLGFSMWILWCGENAAALPELRPPIDAQNFADVFAEPVQPDAFVFVPPNPNANDANPAVNNFFDEEEEEEHQNDDENMQQNNVGSERGDENAEEETEKETLQPRDSTSDVPPSDVPHTGEVLKPSEAAVETSPKDSGNQEVKPNTAAESGLNKKVELTAEDTPPPAVQAASGASVATAKTPKPRDKKKPNDVLFFESDDDHLGLPNDTKLRVEKADAAFIFANGGNGNFFARGRRRRRNDGIDEEGGDEERARQQGELNLVDAFGLGGAYADSLAFFFTAMLATIVIWGLLWSPFLISAFIVNDFIPISISFCRSSSALVYSMFFGRANVGIREFGSRRRFFTTSTEITWGVLGEPYAITTYFHNIFRSLKVVLISGVKHYVPLWAKVTAHVAFGIPLLDEAVYMNALVPRKSFVESPHVNNDVDDKMRVANGFYSGDVGVIRDLVIGSRDVSCKVQDLGEVDPADFFPVNLSQPSLNRLLECVKPQKWTWKPVIEQHIKSKVAGGNIEVAKEGSEAGYFPVVDRLFAAPHNQSAVSLLIPVRTRTTVGRRHDSPLPIGDTKPLTFGWELNSVGFLTNHNGLLSPSITSPILNQVVIWIVAASLISKCVLWLASGGPKKEKKRRAAKPRVNVAALQQIVNANNPVAELNQQEQQQAPPQNNPPKQTNSAIRAMMYSQRHVIIKVLSFINGIIGRLLHLAVVTISAGLFTMVLLSEFSRIPFVDVFVGIGSASSAHAQSDLSPSSTSSTTTTTQHPKTLTKRPSSTLSLPSSIAHTILSFGDGLVSSPTSAYTATAKKKSSRRVVSRPFRITNAEEAFAFLGPIDIGLCTVPSAPSNTYFQPANSAAKRPREEKPEPQSLSSEQPVNKTGETNRASPPREISNLNFLASLSEDDTNNSLVPMRHTSILGTLSALYILWNSPPPPEDTCPNYFTTSRCEPGARDFIAFHSLISNHGMNRSVEPSTYQHRFVLEDFLPQNLEETQSDAPSAAALRSAYIHAIFWTRVATLDDVSTLIYYGMIGLGVLKLFMGALTLLRQTWNHHSLSWLFPVSLWGSQAEFIIVNSTRMQLLPMIKTTVLVAFAVFAVARPALRIVRFLFPSVFPFSMFDESLLWFSAIIQYFDRAIPESILQKFTDSHLKLTNFYIEVFEVGSLIREGKWHEAHGFRVELPVVVAEEPAVAAAAAAAPANDAQNDAPAVAAVGAAEPNIPAPQPSVLHAAQFLFRLGCFILMYWGSWVISVAGMFGAFILTGYPFAVGMFSSSLGDWDNDRVEIWASGGVRSGPHMMSRVAKRNPRGDWEDHYYFNESIVSPLTSDVRRSDSFTLNRDAGIKYYPSVVLAAEVDYSNFTSAYYVDEGSQHTLWVQQEITKLESEVHTLEADIQQARKNYEEQQQDVHELPLGTHLTNQDIMMNPEFELFNSSEVAHLAPMNARARLEAMRFASFFYGKFPTAKTLLVNLATLLHEEESAELFNSTQLSATALLERVINNTFRDFFTDREGDAPLSLQSSSVPSAFVSLPFVGAKYEEWSPADDFRYSFIHQLPDLDLISMESFESYAPALYRTVVDWLMTITSSVDESSQLQSKSISTEQNNTAAAKKDEIIQANDSSVNVTTEEEVHSIGGSTSESLPYFPIATVFCPIEHFLMCFPIFTMLIAVLQLQPLLRPRNALGVGVLWNFILGMFGGVQVGPAGQLQPNDGADRVVNVINNNHNDNDAAPPQPAQIPVPPQREENEGGEVVAVEDKLPTKPLPVYNDVKEQVVPSAGAEEQPDDVSKITADNDAIPTLKRDTETKTPAPNEKPTLNDKDDAEAATNPQPPNDIRPAPPAAAQAPIPEAAVAAPLPQPQQVQPDDTIFGSFLRRFLPSYLPFGLQLRLFAMLGVWFTAETLRIERAFNQQVNANGEKKLVKTTTTISIIRAHALKSRSDRSDTEEEGENAVQGGMFEVFFPHHLRRARALRLLEAHNAVVAGKDKERGQQIDTVVALLERLQTIATATKANKAIPPLSASPALELKSSTKDNDKVTDDQASSFRPPLNDVSDATELVPAFAAESKAEANPPIYNAIENVTGEKLSVVKGEVETQQPLIMSNQAPDEEVTIQLTLPVTTTAPQSAETVVETFSKQTIVFAQQLQRMQQKREKDRKKGVHVLLKLLANYDGAEEDMEEEQHEVEGVQNSNDQTPEPTKAKPKPTKKETPQQQLKRLTLTPQDLEHLQQLLVDVGFLNSFSSIFVSLLQFGLYAIVFTQFLVPLLISAFARTLSGAERGLAVAVQLIMSPTSILNTTKVVSTVSSSLFGFEGIEFFVLVAGVGALISLVMKLGLRHLPLMFSDGDFALYRNKEQMRTEPPGKNDAANNHNAAELPEKRFFLSTLVGDIILDLGNSWVGPMIASMLFISVSQWYGGLFASNSFPFGGISSPSTAEHRQASLEVFASLISLFATLISVLRYFGIPRPVTGFIDTAARRYYDAAYCKGIRLHNHHSHKTEGVGHVLKKSKKVVK